MNGNAWITVVALALRRTDGRWLMHQRPPEKHHGGLWEFPGGKVECNEAPDGALVREIREELGIAIQPQHLAPAGFAQSATSPDGPGIVILLYRADRWAGEPRALEGGEIAWLTPAEIAPLPKPPLDVALCRALFCRFVENPAQ